MFYYYICATNGWLSIIPNNGWFSFIKHSLVASISFRSLHRQLTMATWLRCSSFTPSGSLSDSSVALVDLDGRYCAVDHELAAYWQVKVLGLKWHTFGGTCHFNLIVGPAIHSCRQQPYMDATLLLPTWTKEVAVNFLGTQKDWLAPTALQVCQFFLPRKSGCSTLHNETGSPHCSQPQAWSHLR